jgi:hypothetical protein
MSARRRFRGSRPDIAASGSMRWCHFRAWVKDQYSRTSLPVLIVGILTLTVAIANYCLQKSANRPELASTGGDINLAQVHPKIAELEWSNIGKKPARRGTVTVFTLSNGTRHTKLGEGIIIAAGTSVMPGYNGGAKVTFDTDQLDEEILACITYFGDDDEPYQQAFLYHQRAVQNNAVDLSELAPPKYKAVCP